MGNLRIEDAEALFDIWLYGDLSEQDQIRLEDEFIRKPLGTFEEAYRLNYGVEVSYASEKVADNVRWLINLCSERLSKGSRSLVSFPEYLMKISLDDPDLYEYIERFVFTSDYADRLQYALSDSESMTNDYLALVQAIAKDLNKTSQYDRSGTQRDIQNSLLYNEYILSYHLISADFTERDVANLIKDLREESLVDPFDLTHLNVLEDHLYEVLEDKAERSK